MEEGRRNRKETENMNGTFLPAPSDSLPISGALSSSPFCVPDFSRVLSLPVAHPAVSRGSAHRQLDEPHAKRPAQNFLRASSNTALNAPRYLRAYNLFRHLVGAEQHAPLFMEERETHRVCRSLVEIMLRAGLDASRLHAEDGLICSN